MRPIAFLLILVSFCFSLAAGESLCCDGKIVHGGIDVSHGNHSDSGSKLKSFDGSHYCSQSDQSSSDDNDQEHQCIGCSHAPFISSVSLDSLASVIVSQRQFSEYELLLSSAYLEGPFQPPKSNS